MDGRCLGIALVFMALIAVFAARLISSSRARFNQTSDAA